jgi:hypothetical protein
VKVLQRVRIVEAPAWRTPRGRNVNHSNQALVQNVCVQLVCVAVEVGHVEIWRGAELSRGREGGHTKRGQKSEFFHVF